MTKSDKIRKAFRSLKNPTASNRQIRNRCQELFDWIPSPQLIRSAMGSEASRKLSTISASEYVELRKIGNRMFSGDFQQFAAAVEVIGDVFSN